MGTRYTRDDNTTSAFRLFSPQKRRNIKIYLDMWGPDTPGTTTQFPPFVSLAPEESKHQNLPRYVGTRYTRDDDAMILMFTPISPHTGVNIKIYLDMWGLKIYLDMWEPDTRPNLSAFCSIIFPRSSHNPHHQSSCFPASSALTSNRAPALLFLPP